jgi:hypothetical protein
MSVLNHEQIYANNGSDLREGHDSFQRLTAVIQDPILPDLRVKEGIFAVCTEALVLVPVEVFPIFFTFRIVFIGKPGIQPPKLFQYIHPHRKKYDFLFLQDQEGLFAGSKKMLPAGSAIMRRGPRDRSGRPAQPAICSRSSFGEHRSAAVSSNSSCRRKNPAAFSWKNNTDSFRSRMRNGSGKIRISFLPFPSRSQTAPVPQ